jgi:DNA-binding beta-propeller fold protein YncE
VLSADNLDIQREIPAGVEPDSLLYGDGRLYVAERGNQSVAVFDYRSGRQLARVAVGYEPVGMIEVDGRIYVGNAGDSYLSAFYAGQNTSALRIATGEGPVALAVSERRRMLYIAEREAKALAVMDLSSERVKAVVPLGGRPTFLAVLD